MAFNEKMARKLGQNKTPKPPVMDQFDLEAEREGMARRIFRVELMALPTTMGKRVNGSKHQYRKTKVGSNHVRCQHREEKIGFGA